MKSPFWTKTNDDKSVNTATTVHTSSITTNSIHVQSTDEEQQLILKRSKMIMNNNKKSNITDISNINPLRRKKVKKKIKDKYQLEACDSNLSSSSFQSDISNASFDSSQQQVIPHDHSDLLDDPDDSVYFINGQDDIGNAIKYNIQPSISEDSCQNNHQSRYCVESKDDDELDMVNKNNTKTAEQRREEFFKLSRFSLKKEKSVIDIAFKQARNWKFVHDEMMLKTNKNEKDCPLTLTLDRTPSISETSNGIEIITTNLDFLEIRDEEPVCDTSSVTSNTSTSTITSCLREPRIWSTKTLQTKNSADSEYMFDLGEEYESLIMFEERSRSVKFSGSFEIRECPSVEAEHKPLLFYTQDEMHRFRQDYYREVDASIDGKLNLFDSVMESIDSFLCNAQPCGGRYKTSQEHLVEA